MPLSPKQAAFVKAVKEKNSDGSFKYQYLLYGGGVGGGKTIVSLGLLDQMAQDYPGTRYAVVRKSLTAIRRNTLPSFKKILELNGDPSRAKLYKAEWTYVYKNGSEILFIEADYSTDPDFTKLLGLEVTAAVIEEGNEVHPKAFSTLVTRIGRWKNRYEVKDDLGNILEIIELPQFIVVTCNPANGWLKQMFYDKWSIKKEDFKTALEAPYFFLQALPADNPYNTKQYLLSLESLPPAEYERFVKGNWEFADDPNQLVEYQWLKDSIVTDEELSFRIAKYIGADIAREGDDDTKLCYADDSAIIRFKTYKGAKTNETGAILVQEIETNGIRADNIGVDAIGLGAGVIDHCEENKYYIRSFKSSEKPSSELPHFKFANRKAEAYWLLREDLRLGRIIVPFDEDFNRQALQIRYFITDKCITIESKKDLKKRIHESPDAWDSAVIANILRRDLIGDGSPASDYIKDIYSEELQDGYELDFDEKTCVMEMVY